MPSSTMPWIRPYPPPHDLSKPTCGTCYSVGTNLARSPCTFTLPSIGTARTARRFRSQAGA
eukprot:974706-Rhodomonas_salina.1